jgi:hypothetical protein
MMPRRRRTREQDRTAAILAERRHNHQIHCSPSVPVPRHDEDIEYEDTFTKEPEAPPF